MKKQQSMSNYRFIIVSPRLQCHCALSDRKMITVCVIKSVLPVRLLDAIQDVVATRFDGHERVVSSSYHAIPRGRSVD